jgi:hypothetical protein
MNCVSLMKEGGPGCSSARVVHKTVRELGILEATIPQSPGRMKDQVANLARC